MKPMYEAIIAFAVVTIALFVLFQPTSYGEAGKMAGGSFVLAAFIYLEESGYLSGKAKTTEGEKP